MLPLVIRKVNIFSKISLIVANPSATHGSRFTPTPGRPLLMSMSLAHAIDAETKLTLNASMLARIRSDIIACRLLPNDRLRMDALRRRYQVGGTPIREALMRLEAEGLVQLEQNKGFRVSAVSKEILLDLMRCRIELENTALRWSIEHGSVAWRPIWWRLSIGFPANADRRARSQVDQRVWSDHHAPSPALVAACDSPTLLTIRSTRFEKAERYVALSIMSKAIHRDDVDEHEGIMRAALARDVAQALKLNRAHIERTTEKVLKSLEPVQFTPRGQGGNDKSIRRATRV